MARATRRSATLILLCCVSLALAQITFSRDWTGGKRSPQLLHDCDQFSRLCRHFVHELRQSMTSHGGGGGRRDQSSQLEDPLPNYDDDK